MHRVPDCSSGRDQRCTVARGTLQCVPAACETCEPNDLRQWQTAAGTCHSPGQHVEHATQTEPEPLNRRPLSTLGRPLSAGLITCRGATASIPTSLQALLALQLAPACWLQQHGLLLASACQVCSAACGPSCLPLSAGRRPTCCSAGVGIAARTAGTVAASSAAHALVGHLLPLPVDWLLQL